MITHGEVHPLLANAFVALVEDNGHRPKRASNGEPVKLTGHIQCAVCGLYFEMRLGKQSAGMMPCVGTKVNL